MPKFQKKALVPWLSATSDGKDGRFIQIGNSLLLSKTFQQLSTGAVHLYMCMAMESGGHWDFKFPLKAAKKYGIASTSLRRYIKELERGGFITVRSNKNLRIANDYRFSVEWKKRSPATWAMVPMAIYSISVPNWYKNFHPGCSLDIPLWYKPGYLSKQTYSNLAQVWGHSCPKLE